MKHNNSDSQLAAALNKHNVSGKQPDYKVIRAAAVIHAEQYEVNQDNFDMMKYSINDFIAGAQWALSQVACASSAVDTVAARGHIHKWHETSAKERICYMCGETEKTGAGSSYDGQP